jgi:hypothetical protein
MEEERERGKKGEEGGKNKKEIMYPIRLELKHIGLLDFSLELEFLNSFNHGQ